MRFSIEVQDEPKMFFHSFPAAEKTTGLHQQTIRNVLERRNPVYNRQSDHKRFTISKEEPIVVAKIEGEEFFSLEEIHTKFGLSPTKFLNQIKDGKFAKKIDWISDELFPENARQRSKEVKKSDELAELREEMRLQFEKFQEEINRLSSKVETLEASLEKEKAELASRPAKVFLQEGFFKSKDVFPLYSFNIASIAGFIRKGIVGEIQSAGPKTRKEVLIDGRKKYLPDLVTQIIKEHLVPVMENETQEEKMERINAYINMKGKKSDGLTSGELSTLRRQLKDLDPVVIADVSKEIMKML